MGDNCEIVVVQFWWFGREPSHDPAVEVSGKETEFLQCQSMAKAHIRHNPERMLVTLPIELIAEAVFHFLSTWKPPDCCKSKATRC